MNGSPQRTLSRPDSPLPGISGFSVYLPPLRVDLERWCDWTDNSWPKVQAVIGRSFRVPSPRENVYTMAATAVLRLIDQYDVDPRTVGMLALGTESSSDNSAGAVILRAMLDDALREQGRPMLAHDCEVPEVKHACLGGIYALKGACRYVSTDGRGRRAIVVAADIAEYERGSSGEQTQGAGAVAMLVEAEPTLLGVDLSHSGSASAYRGPDFRKPVRRYALQSNHVGPGLHDFPVFNGRYSTYCYLDQTTRAVETAAQRLGVSVGELLEGAEGLFFHRPYHWMPVQTLARLHAVALARDASRTGELAPLCDRAGVDPDTLQAELDAMPWPASEIDASNVATDPTPAVTRLSRAARESESFAHMRDARLSLGAEPMKHCGNMYTAALPAWLAAALDEAVATGVDLADRALLAVGYGSGDAAEALPLWVVPGWEQAARGIELQRALEGARDLERHEYEALHDRKPVEGLADWPHEGFVIDRIGLDDSDSFQDIGLEYYGRAEAEDVTTAEAFDAAS